MKKMISGVSRNFGVIIIEDLSVILISLISLVVFFYSIIKLVGFIL